MSVLAGLGKRGPALIGAIALGCASLAAGAPLASASSAGGVTTKGISAAECAANRAAGPITFETSFDYAAAASILDVVVAAQRGYFKDMCLNVTLQPGFSTDNVALVSANKIQITSLGSNSEVIAARARSANLVGVLTYGQTAISELITPGKLRITSLKALNGKTIGIKGALPYEVEAMLVKEGVKISSLHQVQVGYDPTIINQGRIQALPVYKSNEIHQLNALHQSYHVWDPTKYGIAASFGSMVVNGTFAKQHPTAVEDFLRADLAGFNWAVKHPALAVSYAQARVNKQLYITTSDAAFRWRVESGIVLRYTKVGSPIGMVNLNAAKYEYAQDRRLGLVPPGVNLHNAFDLQYLKAVYNGTTLIWPKKFS